MSQAPTISIYQPPTEQADITPHGLWRDAWERIRRNRLGLISLAIVLLYLFVGLIGFIPSKDADGKWTFLLEQKIVTTVGDRFQAPQWSWKYPAVWFGTDIMGHSVFWEIIYGVRLAMTLAIIASLISAIIGTFLGVIAGYFGGWVDSLVIWLFSTFSSVPWILLAIAIATVVQTHETLNAKFSGMPTVILALSLTSWIGLCRLIRGEVLKLRERDYVAAGRAIGLGSLTILWKHIVPNVLHLIIIDFSLNIVSNVQAEVVLAFLGLGITEKPSWGRMIDDSKLDLLRGVWWQLVAATIAIFILSLAMNLLGDVLRDALDPRLRGVD